MYLLSDLNVINLYTRDLYHLVNAYDKDDVCKKKKF